MSTCSWQGNQPGRRRPAGRLQPRHPQSTARARRWMAAAGGPAMSSCGGYRAERGEGTFASRSLRDTRTIVAPLSPTMWAHSEGCCCSYMGTNGTPSPDAAYAVAAHSGLTSTTSGGDGKQRTKVCMKLSRGQAESRATLRTGLPIRRNHGDRRRGTHAVEEPARGSNILAEVRIRVPDEGTVLLYTCMA